MGSCFDNAAAEAFFSSLEWEVLSRNEFDNTTAAQAVVLDWCYGFYNHERRHSSAGMMSPIDYETPRPPSGTPRPAKPSTIRGTTPRNIAVTKGEGLRGGSVGSPEVSP